MANSRVLVVGDLILDQYYRGTVNRISPEAPVPVVNVTQNSFLLGGAGNVVNNLFELGCKTSFLSIVGSDSNAERLNSLLENKTESTTLIKVNKPTTTKLRVVVSKQQLLRLDFEDIEPIDETISQDLKNHINSQVSEIGIILISDYGKGIITPEFSQWIIQIANKNNIKTIIDPKGKDWRKYENAYLVTPNYSEFCDVIGKNIDPTDENTINKEAKLLIERQNIKHLLITRSERGMKLVNNSQVSDIGTVAKDVFDVSGAGDTVVATLGAYLNKGYTLIDAVQVANYAAGIVVGKSGTSPILLDELKKMINE